MRNLLNFLSRYSNLIVFILLEAVSVYLLTTAEGYHSSRLIGGIRGASTAIEGKISGVSDYIGLYDQNARLAAENMRLRNQVERYSHSLSIDSIKPEPDTLISDYEYISARVVNNSVNKQHNFITINKGKRDGLEPEMALIGPEGVAGIIVSVTDNFSYAMSVLNLEFRMSARLRKEGYYGSLQWDGHDTRKALLNEIPYHVSVAPGDTVETSGFSAIFPVGILVGTVSDIDESGGDFYTIIVDLSTDFRRLGFVYAVKSRKRQEQLIIEGEVRDE